MSASLFEDLLDAEVARTALGGLLGAWAVYGFNTLDIRSLLKDSVQHAIDAHLPQGYDRSIIFARSLQSSINQCLLKELRLRDIRQAAQFGAKLPVNADAGTIQAARVLRRHNTEVLLRVLLASLLVGAHVHAALLAMAVAENTSYVLIFLQQKLLVKKLRRLYGDGTESTGLMSWWTNGIKENAMKVMMAQIETQFEPSPFALKDELDVDSSLLPSSRSQKSTVGDHTARKLEGSGFRSPLGSSREARALEATQQRMDNDCSDDEPYIDDFAPIEELLQRAVPLLVGEALAVVDTALVRRGPKCFSVSGKVTGEELVSLLSEITDAFESQVAWWKLVQPERASNATNESPAQQQQPPLPPAPRVPLGTRMNADGTVDKTANGGDDDEIIELPRGSTVFTPQRPTRHAKTQYDIIYGGTTTTTTAFASPESAREDSALEASLKQMMYGSDIKMVVVNDQEQQVSSGGTDCDFPMDFSARNGRDDHPMGAATHLNGNEEHTYVLSRGVQLKEQQERELREIQIQSQLQMVKMQRVRSFFMDIVSSASFNELAIANARDNLTKAIERASDLKLLKTYDEETNSVMTPTLIPMLDKQRQLLFDDDYQVHSYLSLFCGQLVRATFLDDQ